MRIAFTVLANTELSSTRVTKIKVTWKSKRLPITTKGRDVVHKTQNKSYTTFSRHRDRLESLLWRCVVCVHVFVYTIVLYKS